MRTVPPSEMRVVVLERAVDLDRFELRPGRVAEPEVQLAAGLEQRLFRFGNDDPCAGLAFQLCEAGDVVVVPLGRGQDFGIGKLEPELFHACFDLARRVTDAGVDQDVALRCGDQIARQIVDEPTQ